MNGSLSLRGAALMFSWLLLWHLSGPACRSSDAPWEPGGNGHLGSQGAGARAGVATTDAEARPEAAPPAGGSAGAAARAPAREDAALEAARHRMVKEQIEARGVRSPEVLEAMRKVPRHRFVPENLLPYAYDDSPLPIGEGQTISQPYIVALMTELLRLRPGGKVLEVGTGSGYQAAVLSEMGAEVYTIEIVEPLAAAAKKRLEAMGYARIHFRTGDGYRGWPEAASFDAVIVTAAPDHVPQPLVDQLKVGGRLVIPVGRYDQDLDVITKTAEGTKRETTIPVRFVPMTGEAEERPH